MAHESQHVAQADHNEKFLSSIEADYIDWKFIVLYYSALQYVDALIAKKNRTSSIKLKDHNQRKKIFCDKYGQDAFFAYKNLEDYSRTARYHPEGLYTLTEEAFNDVYNEDFLKIKGLC